MTHLERFVFGLVGGFAVLALSLSVLALSIPGIVLGAALLLLAVAFRSHLLRLSALQDTAEVTVTMLARLAREDAPPAADLD